MKSLADLKRRLAPGSRLRWLEAAVEADKEAA